MIEQLCRLVATAADTPAGAGGMLDGIWSFFNLENTASRWLVVWGMIGQGVFFARWIFQWVATERRGASHVPEVFWWCSLLGAMMLLVYFILRLDPVGILGQAVGWTVYSRNLYLIHRGKHAASPPD